MKEKQGENGMEEWRNMEEVLFSNSPKGKRLKWEYIKSLPEMEEFVRLVSETFDPPEDVKVYVRRMEKL